ncbi:hypothetical protein SKAU_G00023800 [Synaphobranchus kaupii]|uniref:Uncharacterized protein n=1 Tax=Synaphobranchus kaupii TaxID=118154 RepID=A0A9Q1GE75_SYNKA|nr:hypothetical protein SKAU_G00023800 [Synaphobranchus kaupii]
MTTGRPGSFGGYAYELKPSCFHHILLKKAPQFTSCLSVLQKEKLPKLCSAELTTGSGTVQSRSGAISRKRFSQRSKYSPATACPAPACSVCATRCVSTRTPRPVGAHLQIYRPRPSRETPAACRLQRAKKPPLRSASTPFPPRVSGDASRPTELTDSDGLNLAHKRRDCTRRNVKFKGSVKAIQDAHVRESTPLEILRQAAPPERLTSAPFSPRGFPSPRTRDPPRASLRAAPALTPRNPPLSPADSLARRVRSGRRADQIRG